MTEAKGFFDPNSTENEGRYRLRDPKTIKPGSYFRQQAKGAPGITYMMGRDKQTDKIVIQAIRFDKSKVSEAEAKAWYRKQQGRSSFEKHWKGW